MPASIGKELAVGLLAFMMTAGCSHSMKECDITCADGFKTTQDGRCDSSTLTALAAVHGGSCRGEEHLASALPADHSQISSSRAHPNGPFERIDFVFPRGLNPNVAERTGVKAPQSSDHAGVVATFHF